MTTRAFRFSKLEDWRVDNRDLRVIHEEVERDYSLEIERPEPRTSLIGNLLQRIIDRLIGAAVNGGREDADPSWEGLIPLDDIPC